jgi:hypothetical protein
MLSHIHTSESQQATALFSDENTKHLALTLALMGKFTEE